MVPHGAILTKCFYTTEGGNLFSSFYLLVCLQGGCWGPLNSPKAERKAMKNKEAESSNISHSSRSISSRKVGMEAGLTGFSRNFQQQSPTASWKEFEARWESNTSTRLLAKRTRGHSLKLFQGKFRLGIRNHFFVKSLSSTLTGCSGRWQSRHP